MEAVEKTLASPDQVWEAQTKQFTQIMDQNLDTPKALQFLLKLAEQNVKIPRSLFNTLGFKE